MYGSAKIWLKETKDNKDYYILSQLSKNLYNLCLEKINDYYKDTESIIDFPTLKNKIRNTTVYCEITGTILRLCCNVLQIIKNMLILHTIFKKCQIGCQSKRNCLIINHQNVRSSIILLY